MKRTTPNSVCIAAGGRIISLLCIWLGFALVAGADVVYLKSGLTKEGTVVSQDEKEVVLEITRRSLKARIRIPLDEIERVEKVKPPKEVYQERLQNIAADDAKAWCELGLWCEERDLSEEARECFGKALKADPNLGTAGEKLGLIKVAGQWLKLSEVLAKANDLLAAGKFKEATPTVESLHEAVRRLDSLKRRDVEALLCRCYEQAGAWAKAQESYDELVKSYRSLTPEVAMIRVKQKLLKEHPDGMIEAPPAKPSGAAKPDLVKAMGDGMKAMADLVGHKPAPKVSLADPKVMDAAIRNEADQILKDAEELVKKADGRALSEKLLRAANPIENLHRLIDTIPNLMRLGTMHPRDIKIGDADEMYAKAVERALDADYLARDISRPLRVTIAKKRVAIIDEFIVQAKQQVESDPLYCPPPPPNAPPDPNAKARILQLNPTQDRVARLQEAVEALEKLYALKGAILKPMSDDLIAECQKNAQDQEPLADTHKKLKLLSVLADDLKECETLTGRMQEAWAKAQAAHPSRFEYAYDSYLSPDALYHFRDKGKSWRVRCDACMSYCEEAMSLARKRRAILSKYPERPQTPGEMDALKNFIIQVYNYKTSIMSQYNKKGGTP